MRLDTSWCLVPRRSKALVRSMQRRRAWIMEQAESFDSTSFLLSDFLSYACRHPSNAPSYHEAHHLNHVDENPNTIIHPPQHWPSSPRKCRVHKFKRQISTQMLHCDLQPARKAIFVKAILGPSTGVTYSLRVLYPR